MRVALRVGLVFVRLLWPPCGIGQAIIFLPCDFFLYSIFSSPNLSGRRSDVYHTSHMVWP